MAIRNRAKGSQGSTSSVRQCHQGVSVEPDGTCIGRPVCFHNTAERFAQQSDGSLGVRALMLADLGFVVGVANDGGVIAGQAPGDLLLLFASDEGEQQRRVSRSSGQPEQV